MTRPQAFAIFLPASVIPVFVRLAAGWVSDHVELKRLLLVAALFADNPQGRQGNGAAARGSPMLSQSGCSQPCTPGR